MQVVRTRTSSEPVTTALPEDRVVPRTGMNYVDPRIAVDGVVAVATVDASSSGARDTDRFIDPPQIGTLVQP